VDIASKSLEARIGQQGAAGSFANDAEGIAALGDFCRTHQAELVAMEATGGYEQQAFAQLSGQGLAVAILNPRSVRQFAQSMGSLEKNRSHRCWHDRLVCRGEEVATGLSGPLRTSSICGRW
jgi:transposase